MTDFATAADRLLTRVRHWEQPRWSADGRADRMVALIQLLADQAADAEERPRRPVPRGPDVVLPDQFRVMADDLLAAAPPEATLIAATEAVEVLQRAMSR